LNLKPDIIRSHPLWTARRTNSMKVQESVGGLSLLLLSVANGRWVLRRTLIRGPEPGLCLNACVDCILHICPREEIDVDRFIRMSAHFIFLRRDSPGPGPLFSGPLWTVRRVGYYCKFRKAWGVFHDYNNLLVLGGSTANLDPRTRAFLLARGVTDAPASGSQGFNLVF
jgi:hypothetical protein